MVEVYSEHLLGLPVDLSHSDEWNVVDDDYFLCIFLRIGNETINEQVIKDIYLDYLYIEKSTWRYLNSLLPISLATSKNDFMHVLKACEKFEKEILIRTPQNIFGSMPIIKGVHAGLENANKELIACKIREGVAKIIKMFDCPSVVLLNHAIKDYYGAAYFGKKKENTLPITPLRDKHDNVVPETYFVVLNEDGLFKKMRLPKKSNTVKVFFCGRKKNKTIPRIMRLTKVLNSYQRGFSQASLNIIPQEERGVEVNEEFNLIFHEQNIVSQTDGLTTIFIDGSINLTNKQAVITAIITQNTCDINQAVSEFFSSIGHTPKKFARAKNKNTRAYIANEMVSMAQKAIASGMLKVKQKLLLNGDNLHNEERQMVLDIVSDGMVSGYINIIMDGVGQDKGKLEEYLKKIGYHNIKILNVPQADECLCGSMWADWLSGACAWTQSTIGKYKELPVELAQQPTKKSC